MRLFPPQLPRGSGADPPAGGETFHTTEGTMADQGLDGFYAKVMTDPALQARLKDSPDAASFVATAVQLGQQHGYSFTAEEVVAKLRAPAGGAEMSEKELAAVAGGYVSFGGSVLCGYCGKTSGTCSATSALPQ